MHRTSLAGYLATCSALAPAHRWVRPDSLHLTLRFLGSIPPAGVAMVSAELRAIPIPEFATALGGVGTFGGRAATVVWLGVEDGRATLLALADAVEAGCAAAGMIPEKRRLNPHLTLARSRDRFGSPLPDLPAPPSLPAWRVDSIALYQSRLGRGGAQYSVLETFKARLSTL